MILLIKYLLLAGFIAACIVGLGAILSAKIIMEAVEESNESFKRGIAEEETEQEPQS